MAATVCKPAGVSVFPLHHDPTADCVLHRLLADQPWRAEIAWPDGFAGGLAHRLDRATSGALLVADDPVELQRIREAFRDGAFVKTYRFRSTRDVPWSHNSCERPLAHARRDRRKMIVQRGADTPHRGRWYPARTAFERVRGSLWQATMHTGVMHQIRAHAAFVGIALDGDALYGGRRSDDPGAAPSFQLHHLGLVGPFATEPVVTPPWASDRP